MYIWYILFLKIDKPSVGEACTVSHIHFHTWVSIIYDSLTTDILEEEGTCSGLMVH